MKMSQSRLQQLKQFQQKLIPTHFKRHSTDQPGTLSHILRLNKMMLNTNTKVSSSNGLLNKSVMVRKHAMPKDQTVLSLLPIAMKMLRQLILLKPMLKDVILFTPSLMLLDAWHMMQTLLWLHMLNSLVPL